MVQDALDGKIDLIVTKSESRFVRNMVDSLTTVRKLKEKGVEVYSQKYKRTIWQCNAKFKGKSKCATPHICTSSG